MSEQFLSELLKEAPRPHRHRLWFYWPVLAFAGICLGTALYALYFEDARLTAATLFVVSGGLTASVTWLEGSR